jgi:hypothetical protein
MTLARLVKPPLKRWKLLRNLKRFPRKLLNQSQIQMPTILVSNG